MSEHQLVTSTGRKMNFFDPTLFGTDNASGGWYELFCKADPPFSSERLDPLSVEFFEIQEFGLKIIYGERDEAAKTARFTGRIPVYFLQQNLGFRGELIFQEILNPSGVYLQYEFVFGDIKVLSERIIVSFKCVGLEGINADFIRPGSPAWLNLKEAVKNYLRFNNVDYSPFKSVEIRGSWKRGGYSAIELKKPDELDFDNPLY